MNATRTILGDRGYVRWLHELTFSLNAAILIIPVALVWMKYPLLMRGRDLLNLVYRYSPFRIPSAFKYADPNRQYFAVLVLAFAACLFLVLRLIARFSFTGVLMRVVAGTVAVAGLPVAVSLLQPSARAVLLEGIAAGICALLYVYGKLKLSPLLGILLLILHFAIWTWLIWGQMWFDLVYPLLGLCSALIWGVYVRRSTENHQAVESATIT